MRLYRNLKTGEWFGTQADARRKGPYEHDEVPTHKEGLLAFLNQECRAPAQRAAEPVGDECMTPDKCGTTRCHRVLLDKELSE